MAACARGTLLIASFMFRFCCIISVKMTHKQQVAKQQMPNNNKEYMIPTTTQKATKNQ